MLRVNASASDLVQQRRLMTTRQPQLRFETSRGLPKKDSSSRLEGAQQAKDCIEAKKVIYLRPGQQEASRQHRPAGHDQAAVTAINRSADGEGSKRSQKKANAGSAIQ